MSPAEQLLVAPTVVGLVAMVVSALVVRDAGLKLVFMLVPPLLGVIGTGAVDFALHGAW